MMNPKFSVIYAHRNRDVERIKISFQSLQNQQLQNFEVVFVDYGSNEGLVKDLTALAENFSFVRFFYLPVPQVLWNKSRALNYGIRKTKGEFVFIADTDLVFHPNTTTLWNKLLDPKKFYLFTLNYLDKANSTRLFFKYDFEKLKPQRSGEVNGMLLTSKESLCKVNGFDEFFHFYGAEDEDLFGRLENAGYGREHRKEDYFYHQWHQSFSDSEDTLLTVKPRIKNIMRINYRHFQRNRERGTIQPLRQEEMGKIICPERAKVLETPESKVRIPNMLLLVEHFLREELPSLKGQVIQAEFYEDPYFRSLKFKLKKVAGIQAQPYISLKEVNDMILKEILYNYRNHNYSFRVGNDLEKIVFCLEV